METAELVLYAILAVTAAITVVSLAFILTRSAGQRNEIQQKTDVNLGNTAVRSSDHDSQRTGSKREQLSIRPDLDEDDVRTG